MDILGLYNSVPKNERFSKTFVGDVTENKRCQESANFIFTNEIAKHSPAFSRFNICVLVYKILTLNLHQ